MQSCAFNKYHVSFPDHPTWNEVPGYSARYVPVVYGYHGYGGWREAEGIPCPSKESLPPAMYWSSDATGRSVLLLAAQGW